MSGKKVIYYFEGRVLPEVTDLTLPYGPEYLRTEAQEGSDALLKAEISNGKVSVWAEVDENDKVDPDYLYFLANDLIGTLINVARYREGVGYTAIIDRAIDPHGVTRHIVSADRGLAKQKPPMSDARFEEIVDFAIKDVAFARALEDATCMLTRLHYIPIAAGRVVESVLRMLTNGRTEKHWEQMRSILNVDRSYLQLMTDHSKSARHGDRQYVEGERNAELAKRAWVLLDRFVELKLSGRSALEADKFPILVG